MAGSPSSDSASGSGSSGASALKSNPADARGSPRTVGAATTALPGGQTAPSSSTGTPDVFAPISTEDDDGDGEADDDDASMVDVSTLGPQADVRPVVEGLVAPISERRDRVGRSSEAIRDLGQVEKDLARVLEHAGNAIASLSSPDDASLSSFSDSLNSYYSSINAAHLAIRTSLAHLRAERISPRVLFQPAFTSTPSSVGLGDVDISPASDEAGPPKKTAAHDTKSLEALYLERRAWQDLLDSLKAIPTTAGDAMQTDDPT